MVILKTLSEVIKEYNLEEVDKKYKDVYGNKLIYNDLSELNNLIVRDFRYNIMLNKVSLTLFEREKLKL